MKSLEVAKALELSFANREAFCLRVENRIKRIPHGDNRVFLILTLSTSQQVLTSRSFTSFNYFQEGIDWLETSGKPAPAINHFFDQGPLFREGADHFSIKRRFKKVLDEQITELDSLLPHIETAVMKRATYIRNALDFSTLFIRLCVGLIVSNLTSIPLSVSMRILRRRTNVFYFYFHPVRHRRADAALTALREAVPRYSRSGDDALCLVAQSLLVMGYDPLVGSLCAALSDKECNKFSEAPKRCCPTSFVSRLCVADATIDGFRFNPGDVCYLSLVPTEAEKGRPTFPFGLGVHACVGKQFSIAVLERAEQVASHCFPKGFEETPEAYGDGAFLAFKRA